jgi:hypothetical protein
MRMLLMLMMMMVMGMLVMHELTDRIGVCRITDQRESGSHRVPHGRRER